MTRRHAQSFQAAVLCCEGLCLPHVTRDSLHCEAYTVIPIKLFPSNANIIGSHVLYKMKQTDNGSLKLKAQMVLHGNRDKDRFAVRHDSASANLTVIRFIISLSQILGFALAAANIKGAYMQSRPITRTIFVRPLKQRSDRDCIWKLVRLPYGIFQAGRQWLWKVEQWMVNE